MSTECFHLLLATTLPFDGSYSTLCLQIPFSLEHIYISIINSGEARHQVSLLTQVLPRDKGVFYFVQLQFKYTKP